MGRADDALPVMIWTDALGGETLGFHKNSLYKGELVQVHVLTEGFAYAGRVYLSLSAVAKAITGSHTNGYHFFRNTLNHLQETA
jgi:hypothetical protein